MCECMCGYFSVGAVSMCFGVLCDFLRVFRNRVIYVVKTSILYDGQIGTTFFPTGLTWWQQFSFILRSEQFYL